MTVERLRSFDRLDRYLGLFATCVALSFLFPEQVGGYFRTLWPALRLALVLLALGAACLLWVWRGIGRAWGRWLKTGALTATLAAAALFRFWWSYVNPLLLLMWIDLSVLIFYLCARDPEADAQPEPEAAPAPAPEVQFLLDAPAEADQLGRAPLAGTLVQTILSQERPQAMIIALNGGWGSGKSTVMKFMERELTQARCQTRWVNAWHYDNKAMIWQAVIQSLVEMLRAYSIFPYAGLRRYYRAVTEVLKSAGNSSVKPLGILLAGLPTTDELEAAKREVGELLGAVAADGRKVVVFIDDLDRCSAESAVGTLEFLKEVTDFHHCVFVLGIDTAVVIPMLDKKYADGRRFLQKVLTLSVDLNDIAPETLVRAYAGEMIRVTGLPLPEAQAELRFLVDAVGGNPRAVKQVLNSLIVLREVLRPFVAGYDIAEYAADVLGAEIIRLRYPEVHQSLKQAAQIAQFELAGEDADARAAAFKSAFSLPDPDAHWISRAFWHRAPGPGPFGEGGSLPRTVLYSYADQPGWMPECQVVELLSAFDGTAAGLKTLLDGLCEGDEPKAREFVERVISRKHRLLYALAAGREPGQPEAFDLPFYRRFCDAVLAWQWRRKAGKVLHTPALRTMLLDELTYAVPMGAFPYLEQVLSQPAMPLRQLRELAKDLNRLAPDLRRDYELLVFGELWRRFLAELGQLDVERVAAYRPLLDFEPAFLLTAKPRRMLLREAPAHAGERLWVERFLALVRLWCGQLQQRAPAEAEALAKWAFTLREAWAALGTPAPLAAEFDQLLEQWGAVVERLRKGQPPVARPAEREQTGSK